MKPEYFVPALITLAVTGVVGYMLYKKYAPTIGMIDTSNSIIGAVEAPFIGLEDWFASAFRSNASGNGYAGTSAMF